MKEISKNLLDKKYFIFDIDGTLVDSMGMWNLIDQSAVISASGIFVSEEEIKMVRDAVLYSEDNLGGNIYDLFYAEMIQRYNLNLSVEEYKKLRLDYARHLSVNEVDFKPGAGEFLLMLHLLGKKIGIATTTTKAQLETYSTESVKMKDKVKINKVANAIVTCEDVTFKKPHPEAYNKVVELLGAKKRECVVFEDSLAGVMAAKEAGLEVVAVYDPSAANEQEYIAQLVDYQVESFDELIKVLELDDMQSGLNF